MESIMFWYLPLIWIQIVFDPEWWIALFGFNPNKEAHQK